MSLAAEQGVMRQFRDCGAPHYLHHPRAARCTTRATAGGPEPGMKSLATSPSQQVRPLSDPLTTSTSQPSVSPYSSVQPPIPRSYNVSLFDALKFNGPAPEVINCRLAMIGFLYAASNEASSGKLVTEQFQESPWFPLAVSTIFIWASLVPITKGAKRESFGWFTPRAELTNGRTACLAFAVLLFLEYKSGVAFF